MKIEDYSLSELNAMKEKIDGWTARMKYPPEGGTFAS